MRVFHTQKKRESIPPSDAASRRPRPCSKTPNPATKMGSFPGKRTKVSLRRRLESAVEPHTTTAVSACAQLRLKIRERFQPFSQEKRETHRAARDGVLGHNVCPTRVLFPVDTRKTGGCERRLILRRFLKNASALVFPDFRRSRFTLFENCERRLSLSLYISLSISLYLSLSLSR